MDFFIIEAPFELIYVNLKECFDQSDVGDLIHLLAPNDCVASERIRLHFSKRIILMDLFFSIPCTVSYTFYVTYASFILIMFLNFLINNSAGRKSVINIVNCD